MSCTTKTQTRFKVTMYIEYYIYYVLVITITTFGAKYILSHLARLGNYIYIYRVYKKKDNRTSARYYT
jgi:hypothetical protein